MSEQDLISIVLSGARQRHPGLGQTTPDRTMAERLRGAAADLDGAAQARPYQLRNSRQTERQC